MQSCKTPQTGEVVRVRQRRYIVEDVVAGDGPGDSTLVRLSCLDDDAQGQALEVLWDHEVDPEVLGGEAWREVAARGFDPADRFSAYFHAIRWNCVTATDPKLFQSPFRAGIRIDAYQLEPLRKALLLPRVNLFIADDDRASLSEDELHAEEEAQIEAATIASSPAVTELARFAEEKRLLDEMTAIAEPARWLPDARVRRLIDWIRETMCPELPKDGASPHAGRTARWNEVRVILFTEYEDTKRHIRDQLTAAIAGTDRAESRIEVFSGPTPKDKREEIKRAFNGDPKLYPVRILIATDAAREGLNLQAHCHNLFHIDVPWNPSRMEQRNGRIDRKLQPAPEVYCHYFVYLQRIEDRILRALARKTETIKRELGSLGQVVEKDLARTLGGGIRHGDVEALEREIDRADLAASTKQVVVDELEESRERRDDLDRQLFVLRDLRDRSEKYIGLREDHFRAALSTALGFLGAQALKPLSGGEPSDAIGRYEFPAIDQRLGADPSWADTAILTISNPTGGATLGLPASMDLTVTEDDPPASSPGTLQFSLDSSSVDEGEDYITLDVVRSGGLDGIVTVQVATSGGDGVPGAHYMPVEEMLTFAAGESTKAVLIPILHDGAFSGARSVIVTLRAATGGATLGPRASASVIIRDIDPPPLVTLGAVRTVVDRRRKVTQVVISLSGAVNPAQAASIAGYRLATAGKKGSFDAKGFKTIRLRSAAYDAVANTVTLTLAKPLKLSKTVQLRIGGLSPSGLTDRLGRLIDGDRDGEAGGNAVALLGRRGVTISRFEPAGAAPPAAGLVDLLLDRGDLDDMVQHAPRKLR